MRISALLKTAALTVAVVAGWSLPAAAIDRTWADVREGGTQRETTVQSPLFTEAREAPAMHDPAPLMSYASDRESSSYTVRLEYPLLASVREVGPATPSYWANTWTAQRERHTPVPAAATAHVNEPSSDPSNEIVFGSALVAAFLLGAGLGLAVSRRRVPSVA